MPAGDAEIERLELEHAVLEIHYRVEIVQRQIGRDEALAAETDLGVDDAQGLEVVGLGRQRPAAHFALGRFLFLRGGHRLR